MIREEKAVRKREFYNEVRMKYGEQWYDHVTGVEFCMQSLEGFNFLETERHIAGYKREERLNQFLVLGRWRLDPCGNVMKAFLCGIGKNIPIEMLPDLPSVIDFDEFCEKSDTELEEKDRMFSFNSRSDIPPEDQICPCCGRSWDIDSCHDVHVVYNTEVVNQPLYTSSPLGDLIRIRGNDTDALYRFPSSGAILRNDRFIDNSLKHPNPTADWQKGLVENEKGWVCSNAEGGIDENYIIQKGDEFMFNVWRYYHRKCYLIHRALEEEKHFSEIVTEAGFTHFRLVPIENGYVPYELSAPWFNVETPWGDIFIGWRKRVISINWSDLGINMDREFSGEGVTQSENSIHAWGKEKAIEYLSKILYRLKMNDLTKHKG